MASEVQLGAFCDRVTVGHVGPMANQYRPDGIPFLRSQDIQPFSIKTDGIKFIDEEFHYRLRKSELRAGDVVIVRTGYPGTAAVVPPILDGANCADLVIITPGPGLDPWFVISLLNSTWGRSTVAGNLVGVAQQHFNVGAAKTLRVRLPELSTQRRIGQIIKNYCDLIENNTRRISILEETVRYLHRDRFTNGQVGSFASVADAGKWKTLHLCDLVDDIRDTVLPGEIAPDTVYVGLEHMPRRSTTLTITGRAEEVESTKLKFHAGDILFCKIRPYFHKVIYAPFSGVTSTDAIVMRPRSADLGVLALCVVSSDKFVAHAVQTSNGTKMPRARWDVLLKYPVECPPEGLLVELLDTIGPTIALCAKLAEMNVVLKRARDMLVPKLISGEIELCSAEREVERAPDRVAAE